MEIAAAAGFAIAFDWWDYGHVTHRKTGFPAD
jgi:hypothetical protein